QIKFLGASRSVTGSCYLVKTTDCSFLVDCGAFQGDKELLKRNKEDFDFDIDSIDFVLITHAHIDHSGLLPKLVKYGYNKTIYSTHASIELMKILLEDSARIMKSDCEWKNKKIRKAGEKEEIPLFDEEDVKKCEQLFEKIVYGKQFKPSENISITFKDAGHIMGSAIIELKITENSLKKTIIFGGDLGHKNQAIINDPDIFKDADVVIIESTYGDRNHKDQTTTNDEIVSVLKDVYNTKGTLLIPAFALGRTQEIIYRFFELSEKHNLPKMDIYLDSPMGEKITEIYRTNQDLYDFDARKYIDSGKHPLYLPLIKFVYTKDQSIKLNDTPGPKIIISSSGMCEAGRIVHHLKHNIWNPLTQILFIGFQAENSLGRRIVNGEKKVKIFGENVNVMAKIHTIGGLSAHADQKELLEWLINFKNKKTKIFLVHGEDKSLNALSSEIKNQLGFNTFIPDYKDIYDLEFLEDETEISKKINF
ncbi:MAG TPA: MBL fold metallo-hydrolase, partial [Spirochaetota bacterium]|nr:MBL fold metallo-hydrolase [Spirochaetota bacterium]